MKFSLKLNLMQLLWVGHSGKFSSKLINPESVCESLFATLFKSSSWTWMQGKVMKWAFVRCHKIFILTRAFKNFHEPLTIAFIAAALDKLANNKNCWKIHKKLKIRVCANNKKVSAVNFDTSLKALLNNNFYFAYLLLIYRFGSPFCAPLDISRAENK